MLDRRVGSVLGRRTAALLTNNATTQLTLNAIVNADAPDQCSAAPAAMIAPDAPVPSATPRVSHN